MYNFRQMFGNDSGEDENQEVLDSYFVALPQYKDFLQENNPLCIVRARKGMGKSALLSNTHFHIKNDRENDIVIRATGNELLGLGDFTGKNQAYLENLWKQVICRRICLEIGKNIGFAASDATMTLVETAEIEGYKDKNIVGALVDRIGGLLKDVIGVSLEPKKSATKSPVEMLRRYQENKNPRVWLFIDDIDAKYQDDEEHQNVVGSFFSAIRALAFNVRGLCIRASVRTDVWYNLRKMEDQDKIRQYITEITWKDEMLRKIFAKKILAYLQRDDPRGYFRSWNEINHYDDIIQKVFPKYLNWGLGKEEPFVPIKILAGGRPRWMGQLCKIAGEKSQNGIISMSNLSHSMEVFGKEKIGDLLKEHSHQFFDLEKIIDAFRSGKREYNRFALITRILENYTKKVDNVPDINGYPYKDAEQLGEFLFQIEFLTAQKNGTAKYIIFQDDPTLFQQEQNKQNKIFWSVNSSYRNYLHIA